MSKKCLINIIGAPRKFMEQNANSIKEMIIKTKVTMTKKENILIKI
jgi:hypothetical protein